MLSGISFDLPSHCFSALMSPSTQFSDIVGHIDDKKKVASCTAGVEKVCV